mmetsp:Transcript_59333/g.139768  ORF Transcript_59333/g.139768 Transcript_59333/m.139768 type:complete len:373 (+) Transcript_59333:704-1822(+)
MGVGRLRLLLHLDFALNSHDLALLLDKLLLDALLLLERRLDLHLQPHGLLFEVLERVCKVGFEREVVSLQRRVLALVASDEVVELRHVRVHARDGRLQLRHLLLLHPHLPFDAHPLLGEHGRLRFDFSDALRLLRRLVGELHELRLGAHPHALQVVAHAPLLVDLVPQALNRRLEGADHSSVCPGLGLELLAESLVLAVEGVEVAHLLFDLVVAPADLELVLEHQLLLAFELLVDVLDGDFELVVVRGGVERVHFDPRQLVPHLCDLVLLGVHLGLHRLRLLVRALGRLLEGGLVRERRQNLRLHPLGLVGGGRQHLLHLGRLLQYHLLLLVHLAELRVGLLQRAFEHHILLLHALPVLPHLVQLLLQIRRR